MLRLFLSAITLILLLPLFTACSGDEPVERNEEDILGIWTDSAGRYLYFNTETMVFDIRLENDGSEKSYSLMQDSYFYEPGYNFVIFLDFMKGVENGSDSESWEDMVSPDVYQVVSLTQNSLKWCWVDNLTDDKYSGMSKKEIIGRVIQEADKGFTLLPENYQSFTRVSDEEFDRIVDDYQIWEFMEDEEEE
ncbi:MAG: hypothetical protein K2K58_08160 [Muribaculaceae bacterium]|nr:hypothetical protein [Muribaculaceae bacterium]